MNVWRKPKPKGTDEQILALAGGKDRARRGWHRPGRWKTAKRRMSRRERRTWRRAGHMESEGGPP